MRIILCDSDLESRSAYRAMTEKILADNNIIAEIWVFDTAMQMIMTVADDLTPSDIIFMDVYLPQKDGVTAAQELRDEGFSGEIIFLTKSDKYWPQAFELGALQYLLKEKCTKENYEKTLLRAVKQASKNKEQMIWLACGYESKHIFLSEIHFFEVHNKRIVTVSYGDEQEFDFYEQLNVLENRLISKGFVRVHRSFLVNIGQIASTDKEWVRLRNGKRVPVGEKYRAELKLRLAKESSFKNRLNTSR